MEEEAPKRKPVDPLALLFIIGLFAITGALFFITPPESNLSVLNLIIGAVIGIVGTVAQYRWGSSEGSKSKENAMIAEMKASEAPNPWPGSFSLHLSCPAARPVAALWPHLT